MNLNSTDAEEEPDELSFGDARKLRDCADDPEDVR
jgi:hypothetical protein